MTIAAYSFSSKSDWQRISSELIAGLKDATPEINVGFLYLTDHLCEHAENIRQTLTRELGLDAISGTIGLGVCCTGQEFMDETAAVLLGLHIPREHFTEICLSRDTSPKPIPELRQFPLGIVHSDPGRLARIIDPEFLHNGFVCGGLTASRRSSLQFHGGGSLHAGFSAIAFSEQVSMLTALSQGCAPIGGHHEVTGCEEHLVMELDGQPALEVFLEEFGPQSVMDLKQMKAPLHVGILIRHRDNNDFIVRNIIGFEPNQKLLGLSHPVEIGDQLFFARRSAETATQDLRETLERLASRLDGPPKAGLYFSCVGRGSNLFGETNTEVDLIQEVLGEFPLVGFFGNGEISYEEIHSYSGVLVVFP